jgi:hypothetical protein
MVEHRYAKLDQSGLHSVGLLMCERCTFIATAVPLHSLSETNGEAGD